MKFRTTLSRFKGVSSDFHFLSRTSKGFLCQYFRPRNPWQGLNIIRLSICLSLTVWVLSVSICMSESVWIVRIVRTSVHLMFESAKLWCICVNFDTLSVICKSTIIEPSLMPPHPSTWTFGFFYYSWVIFVALESFVISCWVDFWDHPSSSSSPGDHPTSIVIGNIEKRG